MLALTFPSLKEATSHLFAQPTFDFFDVLEATISSYITFSMDGHINEAFFEDEANTDEQPGRLCSWKRLRPVCFSIIKGKQPPVSFQITLFLERDKAAALFNETQLSQNPDIDGFTLRLSYRNHTLQLSTGTVFSRFSMDRDSERLWDHCIFEWIRQKQIAFEEM